MSFKDNIWGGDDLVVKQLISKHKRRIRFLLCVIDIFGKYAWIVTLKGKNAISIFQNFVDESCHKPNRTWTDKDNEFYSKSVKLQTNGYKTIYSAHNKRKSVDERFIKN